MSNNFYMPKISLMGAGSLNDLSVEIKDLHLKKALIVTDKVLREVGIADKLTKVLDETGVSYVIYDGVMPNPTVQSVNAGLKMLKDEKCDFVVALGGGSAHDCSKGIALLATNGGKIEDYEGADMVKKPIMPLICVNTTAGTASEMTLFAIITNEETHVKMALVDKNLTPTVAVNDSLLMLDMPKSLTAATGMDALTHAVEAYVSTAATPITDACAEKAIILISQYLAKAVKDGHDEESREKMAYAEYLAGMAFNNASLGYVHAIAHQLGGFYNLPHGVCNAILLPHVQEFNAKVAAGRLKEVAKLMGVNIEGMTDQDGAAACIKAIKELSVTVGIPSGIGELGAKREDFETLTKNALKDVCGLTNPRKATNEDIMAILEAAF
ncbi:MAG: iron-containing alcohol dehydrogenase [Sarcina sp.]